LSQQREFTDAFSDVDKKNYGVISHSELRILMRSLGHNLNEDDVRSEESNVSLQDFLNIMAKREQDTAKQDKLLKAFSVFDCDGSGFISVDFASEFRRQMTELGPNPYTKEEFDLFLSEYMAEAPTTMNMQHPAPEDQLVDYHEFTKIMLRK